MEERYTIGEASEVVDQTTGTIQSWLAVGLKVDQDFEQSGQPKGYTSRDLLCIAVMARLINCGISPRDAAGAVNDHLRPHLAIIEAGPYWIVARRGPGWLDFIGTNSHQVLGGEKPPPIDTISIDVSHLIKELNSRKLKMKASNKE